MIGCTVACVVSLTGLLFEVLEELLVEDEGHATDFLHFGLCCSVPVDKVGCNSDGQFPAEFFPSKS